MTGDCPVCGGLAVVDGEPCVACQLEGEGDGDTLIAGVVYDPDGYEVDDE